MGMRVSPVCWILDIYDIFSICLKGDLYRNSTPVFTSPWSWKIFFCQLQSYGNTRYDLRILYCHFLRNQASFQRCQTISFLPSSWYSAEWMENMGRKKKDDPTTFAPTNKTGHGHWTMIILDGRVSHTHTTSEDINQKRVGVFVKGKPTVIQNLRGSSKP